MAASKHIDIAEKVKARIEALALLDYQGTAIPGSQVVVALGPYVEPELMPVIFVCLAGTKVAVGGTNESVDWSYPIQIYICDRTPVDDQTRVDHAVSLREDIDNELEGRRLPNVESVYTCEYSGSPVLAPEFLARYHMLAQPITLGFISRELRTPRS